MNNKLIIVTDLGHFCAYRETFEHGDHHPHLKLVEELHPVEAHQKMSDQLTDQAGRFPRGSGAGHINGDLSAGERLPFEAEQERRLIQILAARIDHLLQDQSVQTCHLAASESIHRQLLDAINPTLRRKVSKVLASNLTKADPKELSKRFASIAA